MRDLKPDDWHTICVRLNRWAKAGVLERMARALQQELLADLDLDTLSLDSTIIPVHAHGSDALRNSGAPCSSLGQPAIGRSRGGLTTKLHALVANDRSRYRRRNEVERFCCRLKRFHRIAFRSDKLAAIHLVLIYDILLAM